MSALSETTSTSSDETIKPTLTPCADAAPATTALPDHSSAPSCDLPHHDVPVASPPSSTVVLEDLIDTASFASPAAANLAQKQAHELGANLFPAPSNSATPQAAAFPSDARESSGQQAAKSSSSSTADGVTSPSAAAAEPLHISSAEADEQAQVVCERAQSRSVSSSLLAEVFGDSTSTAISAPLADASASATASEDEESSSKDAPSVGLQTRVVPLRAPESNLPDCKHSDEPGVAC